ncbi:hypothetical protein BJV82DRAFT_664444 [Fennellomyces sp. T-0311]|nr:hypothetical protein BJV82DRAFT_664444 [Fennellomyces sp. T-0311]
MAQKSKGPDLPTGHTAHTQSAVQNCSWISFHHSSVQSFANADYDAAINSSLQALDTLGAPHLSVLDTCAAAYAMKGEFDKAMEAAEKMIECAPTAAAGYLRSGETLAQQGKHEHAVKVYEQGQQKVPVDDERYASLEERKAASNAQINKRLDFLTLLPIDVADIIIEILSDDEDVDFDLVCMDVSRAWQTIIADYPLAWSSFVISRSDSDRAFFGLLPLVGRHVKSLWLEDMEAHQSQKVIDAITSGQFGNIQQLETLNWNVDSETLLKILSRLGNTLTKLIMVVGKGDQAPSLGRLLLACPKLKLLSYQIDEGRMLFGDQDPQIPGKCNIKTLMLNSESLSNDVADAILRRCPNLQGLRIGQCTGDGLKMILDRCPRLKLFGFNGPVPVQPGISVDDLPGMQQIAIRYTKEIVPEHVIGLLRSSQTTLQNLTFTFFDEGPNISKRWAGLKDIKGVNLKQLTYTDGFSMDMHTIIATVIQNCHALQSAMLQSLSHVSGSTLGSALLMLPNLRILTLSKMSNDCIAGLKLFFDGHANKGKTSSLLKIIFHKCNDVPDPILEAISAIKTLQEIDIVQCMWANEWLVKFTDLSSTHSTLKAMCLADIDTITDDVLRSLTKLSSLRELVLTNLLEITADAVEGLVDNMKNLETVKIDCPQFDNHIQERIRKRLKQRKLK